MSQDTAIYAYSGSQVLVSFGGLIVKGRPDGAFVRIEPTNDEYGDQVGIDGGITIFSSGDPRSTITMILSQSSPFNLVLSNRLIAAKALSQPLIGEIIVRDLSGPLTGQSLHTGQAWLRRSPTKEYAREPGTREWVFGARLDTDIAGTSILLP